MKQNWHRFGGGCALLPAGFLLAGQVSATAHLGGVVSAIAGNGACNDTKSVSLSTLQDSISLSAATGCNGGTASVDIHGEAVTGSIGMRATSSGNGFGSSMAGATVGLNDYWLFTAPPGTAANTMVHIPVTIKVDGVISPGALFDPSRRSFLAFNLSISDHYDPLSPTGQFAARGNVATTGRFSRTFTGNVDLRFFGPGSLPIRADIALSLDVFSLLEGSVDFYNTAAISVALPAGFSVTTSAGLPLVFAPVPEAETWLMLLAGLATLGFSLRGRRAPAA